MNLARIIGALTLMTLGLPSFADAATYAIIIGNNAPPTVDTTLPRLRYADDDAARFDQLLSRLADETWLLAVLDSDTQRRHPDATARARAPTSRALFTAVDRVRERIEAAAARSEETTVYFVFSGHGASTEDGTPYLALQDGLLTQPQLHDEILARWPATFVHVVIDACNAGAMVGARGAFGPTVEANREGVARREADAVVASTSLSRFPNVGAIVATTEGREAHEWSRIESGVFTHELLSGALGAADINGDRHVEYSELVAFVASANSRIDDPRAKPNVVALPPAIHRRAPWIRLERLRDVVQVTGDPTHLGRFFVELENGQRYLDAHLGAGERLAFVMPARTNAYLRTPAFEVPLWGGRDIEIDLENRRERTVASRSVDHAYRRALFAAPYGRPYYRGFVDSRALVGVPTDDLSITYEKRDSGPPTASWVAFGVAGVAAAGAVGLGIYAAKTKRDFDATTLQQPAMALSERYDALVLGTVICSGVAALGAGLGIWLWVSDEPSLGLSGSF